MYNRPMYMQEGGLAGSFGSSINPSFSSNGVLESIQEQVSKNGDFLKLMQNRNQGTNTALSTQNPSTPDFNNNSDGSSAIDNLINNDPRFPKPRPAELTAFNPGFNLSVVPPGAEQNPGMDYSQFKPQMGQLQPSNLDYIGDGINSMRADYDKAVEAARKQRAEGFMGRVVLPGEMPFEEFSQGQLASANAGPLQSASSSIGSSSNNPAVLQPTNSGTDSFPSGILQNEMFGNMGRLQNIQQFANGGLADMGRFGDNQMVHAQTGEMVVPQSILQENPQIGMGLNQALVNQGLDPQRQVVGSNAGSMNPMTGQQEFFDLGKLIKQVAPIALSAFAPQLAAGTALGGISPFLLRAGTGALASKLGGGKTKDALMAGLLSGGLGAMFEGAGSQATNQGALKAGQFSAKEIAANQLVPDAVSKVGTDAASESIKGVTTGGNSGGFLNALGIGDDTIASKFLSSGLGQGLSAGLLMQLLSGDDEDEDQRTEFERRPFGAGGPGGQFGGITYANMGGPMGFPRRNGGIDPSEGSGRKDDVPAMLMAGEFVLTKDAVKGLGGGNQRKGIQNAYNMMDKLEARA